MKKLFLIAAISLPLILTGCTNNDQDISPVSPQFEKTSSGISTFPFEKYQSFPELSGAKVTWSNNAKGLSIIVNQPASVDKGTFLFAVLEFDDRDNVFGEYKMVYLGKAVKGTYLITGIKNRSVGSIRVYYHNTGFQELREPYTESQLFNSVDISNWTDLNSNVKVKAGNFPDDMRCAYAELLCTTANTLIFLCKPDAYNFIFPKSPLVRAENLRVFAYCKSTGKNLTHHSDE